MDGSVDEIIFFHELNELFNFARLEALEVNLITIFELYCKMKNECQKQRTNAVALTWD